MATCENITALFVTGIVFRQLPALAMLVEKHNEMNTSQVTILTVLYLVDIISIISISCSSTTFSSSSLLVSYTHSDNMMLCTINCVKLTFDGDIGIRICCEWIWGLHYTDHVNIKPGVRKLVYFAKKNHHDIILFSF